MNTNKTAFNPTQHYYNNTSRDAAYEVSSSSKPDSIANIIMNASFIIFPKIVEEPLMDVIQTVDNDIYLSNGDFHLFEQIMLNPPKPNDSLQKLFAR